MTPLPDWLRLLIFLGVFGGFAVWILAGHYIAHWWHHSATVRQLRWRLAEVRAAFRKPPTDRRQP